MSDLRTWLGILEREAPVVTRVNLENKNQGLKILGYLLKDNKMFITTDVIICRATHPQEFLFTYAIHEICQETFTSEMCMVYAVLKTVKIKPTITMLPAEMWDGKIFSAWEGVLVLRHLCMSVQTTRAKPVAPVVSVAEPALQRDTLSSDMWFMGVQAP